VQHGPHVVVATDAQRGADGLVPAAMPGAAGERPAVGTAASPIPGVTRALRAFPVHGSEARSGQRQEDRRVGGDRLVDAFAPFEAGTDQVPGVASVERGARGTPQLAARPASLEHHVVGKTMA